MEKNHEKERKTKKGKREKLCRKEMILKHNKEECNYLYT